MERAICIRGGVTTHLSQIVEHNRLREFKGAQVSEIIAEGDEWEQSILGGQV